MEQRHKDIICDNFMRLTDILKEEVATICAHLYESCIISSRMKEDILEQGHMTPQKRAGALLDLIIRRGLHAFNALYLGILKAELYEAADILHPDVAPHQNLAGSGALQGKLDPPGKNSAAGGEPALQGKPQDHEQSKRRAESMEVDDGVNQINLPEDFPKSWPSEEHIKMKDSPLKHVSPNSSMYKEYFESLKPLGQTFYYIMQHKPRGRMLIINNELFCKDVLSGGAVFMPDRTGSSLDRDSLSALFDQLGFVVEVHNNLKAAEMKSVFEDECNRDHTNSDCFALTILSHGHKGSVYGTDGCYIASGTEIEFKNYIKIKDIKNMFCRVPSLAGKPKLFFIQACRGYLEDPGVKEKTKEETIPQTSEADDRNMDLDLEEVKEALAGLGNRDVLDCLEDTIPTNVDYFIAMATVPDHVAYRNINLGTWFIQAVVYIFWKYAHEQDLNRLMTWVNALVTTAKTQHGMKQVAEKIDTFRKTFCFFPGLSASMSHPV